MLTVVVLLFAFISEPISSSFTCFVFTLQNNEDLDVPVSVTHGTGTISNELPFELQILHFNACHQMSMYLLLKAKLIKYCITKGIL